MPKTRSFILLSFLLLLISLSSAYLYRHKETYRFLYTEIVDKGKMFAVIRRTSEVEFQSGGLSLRGTLYHPSGNGPFPGIVLLHGGSTLGRKLALYRVLGSKLARRGYMVLSFDFRGFGESDDPAKFTAPADLDFVEDVRQAVTFLSSQKHVNPEDISIIGHSFGGGVAIPAGVEDQRVRNIVSIAPGRRTYELIWNNPANQHFPRERLARDTQIPEIRRLPKEYIHPILQSILIDRMLEYSSHPPLLLIDGSLEGKEDRRFLQVMSQQISPPVTYVTIPNANHYFGTVMDASGFDHIVTFWPAPLDALVDEIDTWLQEQ